MYYGLSNICGVGRGKATCGLRNQSSIMHIMNVLTQIGSMSFSLVWCGSVDMLVPHILITRNS